MFRLNGSGELAGAPRHWAPASGAKTSHAGTANESSGPCSSPTTGAISKTRLSLFVVVCLVWNPFTFRHGYRGRGEVRGRAATASCLRHLSTRSPFSARSIQPPGSARLRLFSKQTAVIFSFIVVFEKKLFFSSPVTG